MLILTYCDWIIDTVLHLLISSDSNNHSSFEPFYGYFWWNWSQDDWLIEEKRRIFDV